MEEKEVQEMALGRTCRKRDEGELAGGEGGQVWEEGWRKRKSRKRMRKKRRRKRIKEGEGPPGEGDGWGEDEEVKDGKEEGCGRKRWWRWWKRRRS